MKNEFTLASGVTNKVGNNKYFLTLDIDWQTKDDFDKIVEPEIKKLMGSFNLSHSNVFSTRSGFHVYFFYDNSLSRELVIKILKSFPLIDNLFIETFIEFSEKWEWATLRVNGKYKWHDIHFHKLIKWREPSLIEKAVWNSTKELIESQIRDSLIDNSAVTYEVESHAPWNEDKKLKENTLPEIVDKPEVKVETTNSEVSVLAKKEEPLKNQKAKKEKKYISAEEIFPENAAITKERELWYNGTRSQTIARLISSAMENREWAYIKYREVIKKLVSMSQDTGPEYDINGFIERRPFFLVNSISKDYMLTKYDYTVIKSWLLSLPLHMFKSVARFDPTDSELQDAIKTSNYRNFAEVAKVKKYLQEHASDLISSFDIVYDFDTPDADSADSYVECRKLRDEFKKLWVPFSLNFSGSKGFHIKIPWELIAEACPKLISFIKENPNNIKNLFRALEHFAEERWIEIDKWVYSGDLRCLIRVEWSVHPVTWSIVKPLSDREFNSLEWKTVWEIQKMYKPSNLMAWNKELWVEKLNFQKTNIEVKFELDSGRFMTWDDMRRSWDFEDDEWKIARSSSNETNKELKAMAKKDPKAFNEILRSWVYNHEIIEAPEYIDLTTWRNYNLLRSGNPGALEKFIKDLGIEDFSI